MRDEHWKTLGEVRKQLRGAPDDLKLNLVVMMSGKPKLFKATGCYWEPGLTAVTLEGKTEDVNVVWVQDTPSIDN